MNLMIMNHLVKFLIILSSIYEVFTYVELREKKSTSLLFYVKFNSQEVRILHSYSEFSNEKIPIKFTGTTNYFLLSCLRPQTRYYIESSSETTDYSTAGKDNLNKFTGNICSLNVGIFQNFFVEEQSPNFKVKIICIKQNIERKRKKIYLRGSQDCTINETIENQEFFQFNGFNASNGFIVAGFRPNFLFKPKFKKNKILVTDNSITLDWNFNRLEQSSKLMIQYRRVTMNKGLSISKFPKEESNSFQLTNLLCGTQYQISLCSKTPAHKFCSSITSKTEDLPPDRMESPEVFEIEARQVKIKWTSGQNCSSGQYLVQIPALKQCIVYRCSECQQYTVLSSAQLKIKFGDCSNIRLEKVDHLPIRYLKIQNLTPFTEYQLVLTVFSSLGQSEPSNVTFMTRQDKSGPVSNLNVETIPPYQLVTWSAPLVTNGNITAYQMKVLTDGFSVINPKFEYKDSIEINSTDSLDDTIIPIGKCSDVMFICSDETLAVKCYLKPEINYHIEIFPVNQAGLGEKAFDKFIMDTKLPLIHLELNKAEYLSGYRSGNTISLSIPFFLFEPDYVIQYALVVKSTLLKTKIESMGMFQSGGNDSLMEMSWKSSAAGKKNIYEIPLTRQNNMKTTQFVIGNNDSCPMISEAVFCNGPLHANLNYEVAFRAYSDDGFVTSISVTFNSSSGSISSAMKMLSMSVSAGVTIAAVAALIITILVYKKRKNAMIQEMNLRTPAEMDYETIYEEVRERIYDNEKYLSTRIYEEVGNKYLIFYDGLLETCRENPTEYEYAGFSILPELPRAIPIEEIRVRIQELRFKLSYIETFQLLGQHANSEQEKKKLSFEKGLESENKTKNRFPFILPFDQNCVTLEEEPHYINASYIPGYSKDKEFIATQAPLENTLTDFWRMVWEQGCHLIVNLIKLKEDEDSVSCKYWPKKGETRTFEKFEVKIVDKQKYSNTTTRRLMVTYKEEIRCVIQIHFKAWLDKEEPHFDELGKLFDQFRGMRHESRKNPVIVHDCAGIGQTGSFILLNNFMDQIEAGINRDVDISRAIMRLRIHRPLMINSAMQYLFLHKFIVFWLEKSHYIPIDLYAYDY